MIIISSGVLTQLFSSNILAAAVRFGELRITVLAHPCARVRHPCRRGSLSRTAHYGARASLREGLERVPRRAAGGPRSTRGKPDPPLGGTRPKREKEMKLGGSAGAAQEGVCA